MASFIARITARNTFTEFEGRGGHYEADNMFLAMMDESTAIVRMAQVWEGYEESWTKNVAGLPRGMRSMATRIMACDTLDTLTYIEMAAFVNVANAPLPE